LGHGSFVLLSSTGTNGVKWLNENHMASNSKVASEGLAKL
jgi:hypothetical protein